MTELGITLILLGFAIFFFTIIAAARTTGKKRKKRSLASIIGIILIGFGIYEFPIGAMELYKLTEELFSFSILENYLFWILVSISCIIVGIILLRRRK